MGIAPFFRSFLKLFLVSLLFACSGALNNGGVPGEVGGPGGPIGGSINAAADGTLPSQSGYQELDNKCGSYYTLRFPGEGMTEFNSWLIRASDPSYFPKAKVIAGPHDDVKDYAPCSDCQGKVLRVVDLGEMHRAPLLQKHIGQMISWTMNLNADSWNPDLLPQIRYQDFALNAAGEADLSGLEMLKNHLYYFLLSKKEALPVASSTAFDSIQELYDLAMCSKDENAAPFHSLRLLQALDREPSQLQPGAHVPVPQGNDEDEDSNGKIIIRVPSDHLRDLQ